MTETNDLKLPLIKSNSKTSLFAEGETILSRGQSPKSSKRGPELNRELNVASSNFSSYPTKESTNAKRKEKGNVGLSPIVESEEVNPFRMDQLNLEDDVKNKTKLKIYERTTSSSRSGQTKLKFSDLDSDTIATKHSIFDEANLDSSILDSPLHQHIARTLKYQTKETENLTDFITKKREMFLLEYSLSVKREEIKKLDEIARHREEALRGSEKGLEEDAARFDAFLKENNLKTMEAKRKADTETKLKLEKEQEIKRSRNEIASIQNELAKYDEQLEDCRKYKEFLEKLTPPEWLAQQKKGDNESESEPMYFTDPQQLLDIFKQLEESNMFLIQNSQESERVLEDLKIKRKEVEHKMEGETSGLKSQIANLQQLIEREELKASILHQRASNNSSLDEQENKLEELHSKVEEVYKKCIGDNEAAIGTLHMLTKIERKMEELFEAIDGLPKDYVQNAEKGKEKERRQRLRSEKMDNQKASQESRIKRALERSQAPTKKKEGKPIMFRSFLAQKSKISDQDQNAKNNAEEEEEYNYFFAE